MHGPDNTQEVCRVAGLTMVERLALKARFLSVVVARLWKQFSTQGDYVQL